MTLALYQIAVEAHDPATLARWWADALSYRILFEADDEVIIGTDLHTYPGLCFLARR